MLLGWDNKVGIVAYEADAITHQPLLLSNHGALGPRTITLPDPTPGKTVYVQVEAAVPLTVQTSRCFLLSHNRGSRLVSSVVGNSLLLVGSLGRQWFVQSYVGAWVLS